MEKKIVFYTISSDLGGAERSLVELVRGLKKDPNRSWNPVVYLPKNSGPLKAELEKINIDIRIITIPSAILRVSRTNTFFSAINFIIGIPFFTFYFLKLCKQVRFDKPSLIHTTGIKCHMMAALLGKATQTHVLWHIRDIIMPGFTLKVLEFLLKHFDVHAVFNSIATQKSFPKPKKDLETPVVYNGLNTADFYPLKNSRYHEKFGISKNTPIVGMLGVFATWKGQIEFIKASKILVDAGIDCKFVIIGGEIYDTIGESNLSKSYKQLVHQLNLEKHVYFAGFESNSALAINSLDALVHASTKPEPFGRVIIEAMACKVPVICSKLGAAPEFLNDGVEAILVDPREPNNIANAMNKILIDQILKESLTSKAFELFQKKFTSDQYVEDLKNCFKQLAK